METNQASFSNTTESGDVARKADVGRRLIAGIIDAVIAMVLAMIPWIGPLLSAAYWLVRDGLTLDFMNGRSVGKKVMNLRPVRLDGRAMDIETSVRRNWMFGLGLIGAFLRIIPVLGLLLIILLGFIGLVLVVIELVLVVTDPQGRRIGDRTGNTRVVESVA